MIVILNTFAKFNYLIDAKWERDFVDMGDILYEKCSLFVFFWKQSQICKCSSELKVANKSLLDLERHSVLSA